MWEIVAVARLRTTKFIPFMGGSGNSVVMEY